ncbi:hypothetical protein [Spiroplasma ixodetis]|nr:hypothetical protein [Spiroplasma ixodetis]
MDIQQDFYIKKVFYACYVKNIVLPISFLTNKKEDCQKFGIN